MCFGLFLLWIWTKSRWISALPQCGGLRFRKHSPPLGFVLCNGQWRWSFLSPDPSGRAQWTDECMRVELYTTLNVVKIVLKLSSKMLKSFLTCFACFCKRENSLLRMIQVPKNWIFPFIIHDRLLSDYLVNLVMNKLLQDLYFSQIQLNLWLI